jgi:hypothetical protein
MTCRGLSKHTRVMPESGDVGFTSVISLDKASAFQLPHAELGPRIGITCQILHDATFRNYGEVGRKVRIVQRLADDLRRILI